MSESDYAWNASIASGDFDVASNWLIYSATTNDDSISTTVPGAEDYVNFGQSEVASYTIIYGSDTVAGLTTYWGLDIEGSISILSYINDEDSSAGGGTIQNVGLFIGIIGGDDASLIVDSLISSISTNIYIGESGGNGNLSVDDGVTVRISNGLFIAGAQMNSRATITVSGIGSLLDEGDINATFGSSGGSAYVNITDDGELDVIGNLYLGVSGGTGTIDVSNGGSVSGGTIYVGDGEGGTGNLDESNGDVDASTLIVNSGGVVTLEGGFIGAASVTMYPSAKNRLVLDG